MNFKQFHQRVISPLDSDGGLIKIKVVWSSNLILILIFNIHKQTSNTNSPTLIQKTNQTTPKSKQLPSKHRKRTKAKKGNKHTRAHTQSLDQTLVIQSTGSGLIQTFVTTFPTSAVPPQTNCPQPAGSPMSLSSSPDLVPFVISYTAAQIQTGRPFQSWKSDNIVLITLWIVCLIESYLLLVNIYPDRRLL